MTFCLWCFNLFYFSFGRVKGDKAGGNLEEHDDLVTPLATLLPSSDSVPSTSRIPSEVKITVCFNFFMTLIRYSKDTATDI